MYVKYPKVNPNDRPDSWLLDDLEFRASRPWVYEKLGKHSSRFGDPRLGLGLTKQHLIEMFYIFVDVSMTYQLLATLKISRR